MSVNLLPINLNAYQPKLINTNNIQSMCSSGELFKIIQKRTNLKITDILSSLDIILFPTNRVLDITVDLYGITSPNMIILVIMSVLMNNNVSPNVEDIICKLKNSKSSKDINDIIQKIKPQNLFSFLTKLLCAIKYHLSNIIKNKNSPKIEKLFNVVNNLDSNLKRNLITSNINGKKIINLGIITTLYYGFLLNNIYYEMFYNNIITIDKFRFLLNNKETFTLNDSMQFCVYVYDLFNYIIKKIIMPNFYTNNSHNNTKLLVGDYTYDERYLTNRIVQQIVTLENNYFKLYKKIKLDELIFINLSKFNLFKGKVKCKKEELFNISKGSLFLSKQKSIKFGRNQQNNFFIIKLGGTLLSNSNANFGFDGYNIYKIVGNNPLCGIGYVKVDPTNNFTYSFYFKRPLINDYLKIATIYLATALNNVKITMNNIYTFMELVIVICISQGLITKQVSISTNKNKKLKDCVFKQRTKNISLVNC